MNKTKQSILDKNKEYYLDNQEKIKARRRINYENNKEVIKLKAREYEHNNRERLEKIKTNKRHAFRKLNPLPINRGSYNVTLAERFKEDWLLEELTFYKLKLIEDNGFVFYKYGLTKNIKSRLEKIPYKVIILKTVIRNKYSAIHLEHTLLKNKQTYIPKKIFKGYTECFI